MLVTIFLEEIKTCAPKPNVDTPKKYDCKCFYFSDFGKLAPHDIKGNNRIVSKHHIQYFECIPNKYIEVYDMEDVNYDGLNDNCINVNLRNNDNEISFL